MTPGRKPPHCKSCGRPLKGHKRGICEPISPTASALPSRSVGAKTRESAPLHVGALPTLSPQSSQILNDLLRANSYSAPPLQMPEVKPDRPRRSTRSTEHELSLREALDPISTNDTNDTNEPKVIRTPASPDEMKDLPAATLQSKIVLRQFKLEEPSDDSSHKKQIYPHHHASADITIQNFLDSMFSSSPQHPPAIILSFPTDTIVSLDNSVKSHGLSMHVLSLPDSKEIWVPVVIGRNAEAITKLLEDGEKLAQALRRPVRSKAHTLDLPVSMSHVVVGALGALATWAGLAYS